MRGLFLQELPLRGTLDGSFLSIIGFLLIVTLIYFTVMIFAYIYISLALMKIAKRTGTPNGWFAWIPILNLLLIAKIAKMHWWPILLLVIPYGLSFIIGVFLPFGLTLIFVSYIFYAVFIVYMFIWQWKLLEAVGRPGAWVLFNLIPILGWFIYFILFGVAAWGNPENKIEQIKTKEDISNKPDKKSK